MADAPKSYKDPLYASLDAANEGKLGLPAGLLSSVRLYGERSNADQVSGDKAQTVYQIIPATRDAILKQYGIDAYLSPETASEASALLLRDSLKRNGGDPVAAVSEYHGGTNRDAWGPVTRAYVARVIPAMKDTQTKALSEKFGAWMDANPPTGPAPSMAQPPADAKTASLAKAFGAWLDGGDQIPGTPVPAGRSPASQLPQAQPTPEPGLIDKAVGGAAAVAALPVNMIGGAIGGTGGLIGGLAGAVMSGKLGTPEGANMVEQASSDGAQAMTYAPRSDSAKAATEAIGGAMQNLVPIAAVAPSLMPAIQAGKNAAPLSVTARAGAEGIARDVANVAARPAEMVGAVAPGAVGDAAAGAVATGVDAAKAAAASAGERIAAAGKVATTLPRRALSAIRGSDTPTAGTLGSAGAAATDAANQRVATAANLPVPITNLTKGMATRDAAQLKFEVEQAKNMEFGAPLRENRNAINQSLLANFDAAVDATGAQTTTLRGTGSVVNNAMVRAFDNSLNEVRTKYAAARKSPEAAAVVDPMTPVKLTQDGAEHAVSTIDWLNSQPAGLPNTALLDAARQYAVKLGIADAGPDGALVGRPTTIAKMEDWRANINQATGYEPAEIRHATILKSLIDQQTEPVAGPAYRVARAARARHAQQFEDYGAVDKLVTTKKGMADRRVAIEDVFKHSILDGSRDDMVKIRTVLQTSGPEGVQAWKELQGATLRHIFGEDAARSGVKDQTGTRVLSADRLDKTIRALDADEKLTALFGKRGAQTLRDINEISQIAKTVPPEAAINLSNTAMTLAGAVGDMAGFAATGLPVPIFTAGKLGLKYVRDNALRARIADALNQTGK